MTALLSIVVVGIGTYLSRSIFILALARRHIPDPVLVALQFVAPAVLASLVVALLIDEGGRVDIGTPEIAAFVAGGLTAHRTQNHIYTLIAGMGIFWLVRTLV